MSGADDQVPARPQKVVKKDEPVEDEEGSEEDGEENEYVVDKLLAHDYMDDGELHYLVKWKGYEKKSDQTWEPLENL